LPRRPGLVLSSRPWCWLSYPCDRRLKRGGAVKPSWSTTAPRALMMPVSKRTQTGSETTYEAARSAPLSVIASERSAAASRRRRLELVDDQSASSQSESVPPGPSTHVNSRARDFRPTHRQSFDDDAFETLRRNFGSAPEFRASCPCVAGNGNAPEIQGRFDVRMACVRRAD
jgi:hypothetical protein